MLVWRRLREAIDRHGRAAMVTIASARGSSPREAGARMVVHPDGAFTGTIGGGTLEWRGIALAQAALAAATPRKAELRRFALGPELGQCCGGNVELLVETFDRSDFPAVTAFADRESVGSFATEGTVTPAGVGRRIVDQTARPGTASLAGGVLREGFGDEKRPLYLFGAGHVGRALVLALAPLPLPLPGWTHAPTRSPPICRPTCGRSGGTTPNAS